MRELGDGIPGLRRPHHQLARDRPIAGMERQGLFGGETPFRSETRSEVDHAELPVRGVPGRALARWVVRAARDEPALENLLKKALSEQSLSVCAGQIPCTNRCATVCPLELGKSLQGLRELFGWCGHVAPLAFPVALKLAFYVVRILAYYVDFK